jgi:phosphoribosylformimino-5-aminoimidazole carboxamide ribotide isomerase
MSDEGQRTEDGGFARPTLHASHFTVFPAIDLRGGRVVRLAQGDPSRQTVYGDDPNAVAERWKADGAEWLHVVNLDGAFGDSSISNLQSPTSNLQSLISILSTGLKVQFGGGLRDEASVRRALGAGVARAVIGTAAIENPALVEWAVREFGSERIAAGIDAREGVVRVKGWQEETGVAAIELGKRLRAQGVEWCVFTDVARDGVGAGVNVAATAELARATGLRVIASGGVSGMEDVRRVREAGLAGVIVGRALYEGQVRLRDLLIV